MTTKIILALIIWLAFCAFTFALNYGAHPHPVKSTTKNFEKIRLKKCGSCIDIYELESGELIMRLMPHGIVRCEQKKSEKCSDEISEVILHFDKYYNLL